MKKEFIAVVAATMLSACSTLEIVQPGRSTQVGMSDIVTPVKIVDFETDLTKKIEGIAEGYVSKSASLDFYKEQAIAKACAAANVDFMIDPIYTTTNKGGMVTVKATGYGAKYTEIRNAVPGDSIHFKFSKGHNQAPAKSKGQFKLIY